MNTQFPELDFQPCILDTGDTGHLKVKRSYFYLNYPVHKIRSFLWELYSGWLNFTAEVPDSAELTDMLLFYQQLVKFMEVSYVLTKQDDEAEQRAATLPASVQKEGVQPVIDFLVELIEPEKIFLLSRKSHDTESSFINLVIIISDRKQTPFTDLEPLIELAGLKNRRVSCTLCTSSRLKEVLKAGSIFYTLTCTKENLIYDDGRQECPSVNVAKLTEMKEKAVLLFNPGYEKALSFYKGAKFYRESDEHSAAAFMLHQATELSLRAIVLSLHGHDKKTHSLKNLKKYCRLCAPELDEYFPADHEEEQRLLSLLENAYLGTRYTNEYEISPEDLNVVYEKVGKLLDAIRISFEGKMKLLDCNFLLPSN